MPIPRRAAAEAYLRALLNKMLRITTSDNRMFLGELKCTDADRNIILAHTYEYRLPEPAVKAVAATSDTVAALSSVKSDMDNGAAPSKATVTLDMTSRYLGLVVVPGEHIRTIEIEEFISQVPRDGSEWVEGWEKNVDERNAEEDVAEAKRKRPMEKPGIVGEA